MFAAWRGVLCVLLLLSAGIARGENIEIQAVELQRADKRYVLNADFDFDLTARLEEALHHGVTLNFVIEFQLTRPRWYWFDERIASDKLELRLSYLPLSQQYRAGNGAQQESFLSLREALRHAGHVRGWPVLDRDRVAEGQQYIGAVRMRLDTAQLPKAFQMSAVTNRDWTLESDWQRFSFAPTERARR